MKKSELRQIIREELNNIGTGYNYQLQVGDEVTIPTNLTTDPNNMKGQTGIVGYISNDESTICVEFQNGQLGLYDSSIFNNVNEKKHIKLNENRPSSDYMKGYGDGYIDGYSDCEQGNEKAVELNINEETSLTKDEVENTKELTKAIQDLGKAKEEAGLKESDDDIEPTKSQLKASDSTVKLANEYKKVTKEMKDLVTKYKSTEGEEKNKIVSRLKELTKIKKEIENLLY
jgi:hypothetical protein